MAKTKILCLLTEINGNGGIQRFNRNLRLAIKDPFEVQILTLNDPDSAGITGCQRNKFKFVWKFVKMLFTYPDRVIFGHINLNPLTLLTYIWGIKSTVILHGTDAWDPKKSSKWFYKTPQEYWSVSSYTTNRFCEISHVDRIKIKNIFNTIPREWVKESEPLSYGNTILTVTRLDQNDGYKGVDKIIMAIHGIKEQLEGAGWKYCLVSAGNDLKRHIDLVNNLELTSIVTIYSDVRDEELKDIYRKCSFFILPSTGEGFGIVFLEAMAYHKACVGAKNCGSEDVIENEITGFLVDPDVEEIKNSILNLVNNESLCREMGRQGFNKYKKCFTPQQFEETIQTLLISK